MNQVFAGGLALIIAFILWSSKKQTKISIFFKPQKNSFPNIQETSSLVQTKNLIKKNQGENINHKKQPIISTDPVIHSKETKKKLTKLISSQPDDRLLAIKIASEWNNEKAIPFLRRGLKDSDSRVVIAAAAAISSYKGNNKNSMQKSQPSRPPRNVFLMR